MCGVDTAAKTSAVCDGKGKCGAMQPSVETPQPPCPNCGTTYRGIPAARLYGVVPKPEFTPNYICTGCAADDSSAGGLGGEGVAVIVICVLLSFAAACFVVGGAYVPNVRITKLLGVVFWNRVRRALRMDEVPENKTEEKGRERMAVIVAKLSSCCGGVLDALSNKNGEKKKGKEEAARKKEEEARKKKKEEEEEARRKKKEEENGGGGPLGFLNFGKKPPEVEQKKEDEGNPVVGFFKNVFKGRNEDDQNAKNNNNKDNRRNNNV